MARFLSLLIALFLLLSFFVKVNAAKAEAEFTLNEIVFFVNNPNLAMQDFSSGKANPTTYVICDAPVTQFSNDICFDPGDILPGLAISADPDFGDTGLVGIFRGSNNNTVKSISPDGSSQNSVIEFPGNDVFAAGITIGCLFDIGVMAPCVNETYFVNVYGDDSELLGSIEVQVSSSFNTFVGIDSDQEIRRIEFGDTNPQVLSFNAVSKIAFPLPERITNVPTLTEYGFVLLVLLLGVLSVIALRRRLA